MHFLAGFPTFTKTVKIELQQLTTVIDHHISATQHNGEVVHRAGQRRPFLYSSLSISYSYFKHFLETCVKIVAANAEYAVGQLDRHAIGTGYGQGAYPLPFQHITCVYTGCIDTLIIMFGSSLGCWSVREVTSSCHHQAITDNTGKAGRHAFLYPLLIGRKSFHLLKRYGLRHLGRCRRDI